MSRTERLNNTLAALKGGTPDIAAAAVVSEDGLIIASLLPQGVEEGRVAAMSAAMLSIGARTTKDLARGELQQLLVKGKEGYVVLVHAGPHAVLMTLTTRDAKLGLIFFEMARSAETIAEILG